MGANPDVTRWIAYFREAVVLYGANTVPRLMAQCNQESGGNPDATSGVAYGLMQFTPETGAAYGLGTMAELLNPRLSILAGAHYMQDLMDRFGGDWSLALAGYNAGPGAVVAAGNRVPDIPQTQQYVASIAAQVADYAAFGVWTPAGPLPEVRQWDEGPAVAVLQRLLGLAVDGRYGPETLRAVVAQKRRHGLPPDGIVGAGLWQALAGKVAG